MFIVTDNPTFTHTVEVLVPVDGGHDRQTFSATFRVMPVEEEGNFDLNSIEGSTAFLRALVVGLDDLVGADERPVPYSDRLRDQLLQRAFVRAALTKTYYAAIHKAAVGN